MPKSFVIGRPCQRPYHTRKNSFAEGNSNRMISGAAAASLSNFSSHLRSIKCKTAKAVKGSTSLSSIVVADDVASPTFRRARHRKPVLLSAFGSQLPVSRCLL